MEIPPALGAGANASTGIAHIGDSPLVPLRVEVAEVEVDFG